MRRLREEQPALMKIQALRYCSFDMAAAGMDTLGAASGCSAEPDWDRARNFLLFGARSKPLTVRLKQARASSCLSTHCKPLFRDRRGDGVCTKNGWII